MKLFIAISFFFISIAGYAQATDSVQVISRSMLDTEYDQLQLARLDGWIFKPANKENWISLKPTELSINYADAQGKVDGWFKLKIKLDSSFTDVPVGIRMSTWAATDLYIDDKKIGSYGNTGANGQPYEEHMPFNKLPDAVDMKPGNVYTITIHFVDHKAIFQNKLKSEMAGINVLIRLTGPRFNTAVLRGIKETVIFDTIWITVASVLTLLFLLLAFQNPQEKNIRLMAYSCASLALLMFFETASQGMLNLYYIDYFWSTIGSSISFAALIGLLPLTIAGIFQRKVSRTVKVLVVISGASSFIGNFFDNDLPVLAGVVISTLVSLYYIITSWKNLRGAQWAAVVGLLASLFWGILLLTKSILTTDGVVPYFNLYVTGYSLSFPLSLLVYVAIRFKEVITTVQQEVIRQTAEIRTTLDNLKATQSQLVQSEKMASLGELTAGIAHEIQNPLNFVNNFSDLNKELLTEMNTEIEKGNLQEVKLLANDIRDNEEKINQHGKRADSIVKGMLQHSRTSTGQKELVDLNALCDEYLRLSYHGLRAKDSSFQSALKTNYDAAIGKVSLVQQDMGRVIINLLGNAFYAVSEKSKKGLAGYEPIVSLSTRKTGGHIEIIVSDNGNGIPAHIKEKIFQPFFTTKPTGKGTGLGLSLSYEVITRGHGGEIEVSSVENEGTTFTIKLPA